MSIDDIFDSLNAFTNPCFTKNRLSADLNIAVIPKYFLFDFINTEGYFVRHRLVLELRKSGNRSGEPVWPWEVYNCW